MSYEPAWFPLLILLVATGFDLWRREIPDTLAGALAFGAGVALAVGGLEIDGRWSAAGGLLGLLVGWTSFAAGGWGGGDAKLIAALGLWLGPASLLGCLFWMAVIGAGLSGIAWWRGRRDLAYVPAILGGFCLQAWDPNLLARVAGGGI